MGRQKRPTIRKSQTQSLTLDSLKKGVVYLTVGTIEQINWLAAQAGQTLSYYFKPTGKEIRDLLVPQYSLLGVPQTRIIAVMPESLEPSVGLMMQKGKKRKTRGVSESRYVFPIEDDFVYDPYSYIFVSVVDALGNECKELDVKSLSCDSRFQTLKLNDLNYGIDTENSKELTEIVAHNHSNPLSLLNKLELYNRLKPSQPHLSYADVGLSPTDEEEIYSREKELTDALRKSDGYKVWRGISREEFYTLFMSFGSNSYIPFLSNTNHFGLSTFLEPFVKKTDGLNQYNTSHLETFCLWCYYAHQYWKPSRGETWVKYNDKSYFNVSLRALKVWKDLLGQ